VIQIINEANRAKVENRALRALHEGAVVGLANYTLPIARDGVGSQNKMQRWLRRKHRPDYE
jgi:hypothetical protein